MPRSTLSAAQQRSASFGSRSEGRGAVGGGAVGAGRAGARGRGADAVEALEIEVEPVKPGTSKGSNNGRDQRNRTGQVSFRQGRGMEAPVGRGHGDRAD